MKGRNAQIARILSILDLLEGTPGGMIISEIHARLSERGHKASRRTIYRDLDALALAGFPLFSDSKDETSSQWRLERTTRIHEYLVLSAKELFALFLARGALTPLRHTPFFDDLESIFKKLEDRLGPKQIAYLEALQNELKFEPGPAWGLGISPDILETIRSACAEGHLLDAVYSSVNSKSEKERKLGPHYLYYARGGLYLVAEDLEDRKVKVFAVPRFKNAEMLAQAYDGNIVTPEAFFGGSLGVFNGSTPEEIMIEFEQGAAQYVKERNWHKSQRITQLEGGRIRLILELGQTPELVSWVMSFGPAARVLKPETLADRIANQAMETARSYGRKIRT